MTTFQNHDLAQDLYGTVNQEWLATAQIPADRAVTGTFADLGDQVETTLRHDLQQLLDGTLAATSPALTALKTFYTQALDDAQRTLVGGHPLKTQLDEILALPNYVALDHHLAHWYRQGRQLPLALYLAADRQDTRQYALYLGSPHLILPDRTYYLADNPNGQALLRTYRDMARELLEKLGYLPATARELVTAAMRFDALIAPHTKSAVESANAVKNYNPQSFAQAAASIPALNLPALVQELLGTQPAQVIVRQPKFLPALGRLLTTENFGLLRSWLLVQHAVANSGYLTDELRLIGNRYARALSGMQHPWSREKAAYKLTHQFFDQVIGDYYGHQYFGAAARANVREMVLKMTQVYQQRLKTNTWLSPATRAKAILKLQKLTIKVGYPDELPAVYQKLSVDAHQTLFANAQHLNQIFWSDVFDQWGQPVDKTRWDMSADTVNAYYNPANNEIVFPAAILQAPFYSLHQTTSQNYGGIGTTMAHEISHAFDNNGSRFDEYGNLNNWWTDADRAHFDHLAQTMIDEFDGQTVGGQTISGKLTVSENIADAGGINCALTAAKAHDDVDLRAFFINWARIWRRKMTASRLEFLAKTDVHAPHRLRANLQVQNLDDFYTTFNVRPGDGMYRAPAERVTIW